MEPQQRESNGSGAITQHPKRKRGRSRQAAWREAHEDELEQERLKCDLIWNKHADPDYYGVKMPRYRSSTEGF